MLDAIQMDDRTVEAISNNALAEAVGGQFIVALALWPRIVHMYSSHACLHNNHQLGRQFDCCEYNQRRDVRDLWSQGHTFHVAGFALCIARRINGVASCSMVDLRVQLGPLAGTPTWRGDVAVICGCAMVLSMSFQH